MFAERFHAPSFQAAKKAGPGSNPSPQKLKGHPDGSSSAEVAIQSTVQPSDTVTGQTQAPKSKSDKTVRHPKVPADVSAASANAPGPWRREKMGVVTVYQPAGGGGGGAFDKTSDAFQLSGSTAVM